MNERSRRLRKLGIAALIFAAVGIAAYLRQESSQQAKVLARCNKSGGVYVEAHTGPICINPAALLVF